MSKDTIGALELRPTETAVPVRMQHFPRHDRRPDAFESHVNVSHYLRVLGAHKWPLAGFVIVFTACTYAVCTRITPSYESTATIDVDLRAPSAILGQDATRSDTSSDADQFLATQVSLLESDSVLRPVADKYNLLTLEHQRTANADSNKHLMEAPVELKQLKVKRAPNTYLIKVSYRSSDRSLASDVANAVASSYIRHAYTIRSQSTANLATFMDGQLAELRAKMEKSSLALAHFESELNVVNPEEKTSIISARLLQLNTQYTDAQADRMKKEASYNSTKNGSLDAAQVSPQGESLTALLEKENQARVNLANIKEVYGAKHPEARKASAEVAELDAQIDKAKRSITARTQIDYQEALNREQMLGRAVLESKAEFDKLNANSFQYEQMRNEAEGDKKLYDDLVRKIRETSINAGFENSLIRIADPARPSLKPIFPKTGWFTAGAFVLSSLLGLGVVLLSTAMGNTVADPDEVAKAFGARVLGTLPAVKPWKDRHPELLVAPDEMAEAGSLIMKAGKGKLAGADYGEAIRSLRSSILSDRTSQRMQVILITSSMPGEGKSTAAAHLALSFTAQGKRVLLVDGDLRRPSLHRMFNVSNVQGLSSVILGEVSWHEARLKSPGQPNLDLLPAGPASHRACDLIDRISNIIMEEAADEYDLVIIDSPPLLGFAEPLEMACFADGVVVITRAGQTNRKVLSDALRKLTEVRANLLGVVLNGFTPTHASKYYKHYYVSRASADRGRRG